MFKKILVLLIAGFLFSCSSLPEQDGEFGILVISVSAENETDRDFIVEYQFNLDDEKYLTRIKPSNQLKFIRLEAGEYNIDTIQSVPFDRVSKRGKPSDVNIPFNIEANKVTVLQKSLDIKMVEHATKEGWVSQKYYYNSVIQDQMFKILYDLEKYKNSEFWGISKDRNVLGKYISDNTLITDVSAIEAEYRSDL